MDHKLTDCIGQVGPPQVQVETFSLKMTAIVSYTAARRGAQERRLLNNKPSGVRGSRERDPKLPRRTTRVREHLLYKFAVE